jgi:hypothetical protein
MFIKNYYLTNSVHAMQLLIIVKTNQEENQVRNEI